MGKQAESREIKIKHENDINSHNISEKNDNGDDENTEMKKS